MAYASKAGRASANSSSPSAYAVCDRCSIWTFRRSLQNQMAWRGSALLPTYMFVCNACYDLPNENLRAIVLPADPVPINQPRTEPFLYDSTEDQTTPYGVPVGLVDYAISSMAVNPATGQYQAYGVAVPVLSLTANGTTTIAATCSAAHGLSTDDQVSVSGLSNALAAGFFSLTVTGATTFTYATANAVPAGSLLTGTSRIVTVLVGLPRGSTTITQVD